MKLHLVQWIRPSLFALSLGCMLFYCSPPATAGVAPVAAGFSLRCVAAVDSGDTSQAKACGYASNHGSDLIETQPAGVLFASNWTGLILNSRARVMQMAVVAILIGIFLLRKTNYH